MGQDHIGERQRLLPLTPVARKLIAKYLNASYKHSPDSRDYAFLEYQLCTLLEIKDFRQSTVRSIACVLGCNPIVLYNDPLLPF